MHLICFSTESLVAGGDSPKLFLSTLSDHQSRRNNYQFLLKHLIKPIILSFLKSAKGLLLVSTVMSCKSKMYITQRYYWKWYDLMV